MTSPFLVSNKLPSLGDIQAQIDAMMQQLNALTAPGAVPTESSSQWAMGPNGEWGFQSTDPFITLQAQQSSLQKSIQEKQTLLASLKTKVIPMQATTPAPQQSAALGPRIPLPRVGLNDLKILLPKAV